MDNLLGFDLLVGILALQGLIADVLIVFGIAFVVWLWLADKRWNRQQEQDEYEGMKQSLFDQIE